MQAWVLISLSFLQEKLLTTLNGLFFLALLEQYSTVRQIVLMTDNINETISFYESCGLTRTEKLQLQTFVRLNKHE